ncbi:MAG: hypothetical protein ACRDKA_02100 [Actinomycetota bacterium]
MKYFLLVYDPRTGRLDAKEFDEREREQALHARFERELAERGRGLEVVLLSAESLEALKHTHARYFATPTDLADRIATAG